MVDLQMHSTYSDGSKTPLELVREARDLGLSAIALTDHDTIDGLTEFLSAGRKYGITTVAGVEISVDTKLSNNGHMHILGLFIDPDDQDLKSKLNYLRTQRNLRAEKIIRKLNELGIQINLAELEEEAGEGSIGRPHVAKILLKKKVVSSMQEAFDIYLAKGKPAYMDKVKFGEADAIQMIKDAHGLAILAHPHLMNFKAFKDTAEKILTLQKLGLDGVEVFYSGMPASFSKELQSFTKVHHLVNSGGSDYHGLNKDHIRMGFGKGDLNIPNEVYSNLKKYWLNSKVELFRST